MPKGVTTAERVILTRNELQMLRDGGRRFNRPRVTLNNLAAFKLANEDLRAIPDNDLIVLEVVNG